MQSGHGRADAFSRKSSLPVNASARNQRQVVELGKEVVGCSDCAFVSLWYVASMPALCREEMAWAESWSCRSPTRPESLFRLRTFRKL